MNEPSDSATVKPPRRLKFSIRTMLIVVTLVSVGIGGARLWVLWNTEYYLHAGVGIKNWTGLGVGDSEGFSLEDSLEEMANRFNYEQRALAGVVLQSVVQ